MLNELRLVGTAHFDPKGEERLNKLLHFLSPDIITLELYEEGRKQIEVNKKQMNSLLEENGIDQILVKQFMNLPTINPFEVRTSEAYTQKKEIPLHLVDIRTAAIDQLAKDVNEIIGLKDQKEITNNNVRKIVQRYHDIRTNFFKGKAFDIAYYNDFLNKGRSHSSPEMYEKKDTYMSEQIKQLHTENPTSRIVHVGGIAHCVRDNRLQVPTLGTIFPKSKIYKLPDADVLLKYL